MAKLLLIYDSEQKKNLIDKFDCFYDVVKVKLGDDIAGSVSTDVEGIVIACGVDSLDIFWQFWQKGFAFPCVIEFSIDQDLARVAYVSRFLGGKFFSVIQGNDLLADILQGLYSRNKLLAAIVDSPVWAGHSKAIADFKENLQVIAKLRGDLIVRVSSDAEREQLLVYFSTCLGVGQEQVAYLNLSKFNSRSFETGVWSIVNSLMEYLPSGIADYLIPRYRIIYVSGVEKKDFLFFISLLEWVIDKRKDYNDKKLECPLKFVIEVKEQDFLASIPKELFEHYYLLDVPDISLRGSDSYAVSLDFIKSFSDVYGKNLQNVSLSLLEHFKTAAWSSNIDKIRYNLGATLSVFAGNDTLDIRDIYTTHS